MGIKHPPKLILEFMDGWNATNQQLQPKAMIPNWKWFPPPPGKKLQTEHLSCKWHRKLSHWATIVDGLVYEFHQYLSIGAYHHPKPNDFQGKTNPIWCVIVLDGQDQPVVSCCFFKWATGKKVHAGILSHEVFVSVYALKAWKPRQWTPKTDTLTWYLDE